MIIFRHKESGAVHDLEQVDFAMCQHFDEPYRSYAYCFDWYVHVGYELPHWPIQKLIGNTTGNVQRALWFLEQNYDIEQV